MTERLIERLLYASRWLLAPLYLGLSLALAALTVQVPAARIVTVLPDTVQTLSVSLV